VCFILLVDIWTQKCGETLMLIGVYSEDSSLQSLLSSSLSRDLRVLLEPAEDCNSDLISAGSFDFVLLDLRSNRESGPQRVDCFKRIIASGMNAVIIADEGLRAVAIELVECGALDFFNRRSSLLHIETILRRAIANAGNRHNEHDPDAGLNETNRCDQLVGSSPQMQQVFRLINSVANLNASVLITGESGTGKELIARAIHRLGSRSRCPFVAVSAGAIPETLLEAEIFGHEKGAFTGTIGARKGYFEEAGNGTLFLDEIGDLNMHAQVMLLRVLQEREFSRLGSNRLIPMRARVIFATHKNLEKMVANGEFREDLYYRINVVRISAPALREHPEDIPAIAGHYVRQYAQMFQKPVSRIDPDAIRVLQRQPWNGNVRELENIIQTATILATGASIRVEDLPFRAPAANVVSIRDYETNGSFEEMIRDYKVKLAETAIRENNGNKSQAARSLSISRAYLHRLIRLGEDGDSSDLDNAEAEVV
jgi:DNA-binding NtrC family response regulator